MLGKLKDLTLNRDESQNLTITISSDCRELFDKLKDVDVDVDIKKASKRRSLEANSYLWLLCGEIAKATSKYSTDGKNEIYREAIKAKGEWDAFLIRRDALDRFMEKWTDKGTGWFAELIDNWRDNYVTVHAYYGSSTYDTLSMSKIIDYVINIANDLGIPTITPKEEERMLAAWGKRYEKKAENKNGKFNHAGNGA